ncbi:antibiotic ABC transporter ATP-binding protein [Adhaeribacter aerolatus]|uniref:Antibiotic ABC transporter ATP-binding protein n=1 Tax=Adhaeribacter aerolatus TaxID=670289 RepID=A0A512B071_9BACT|nr:ABC transporter ATP-binding protein [Adhaeribacter aerolatus]GEO05352.1 antibiotic ABC transporter ATP-binding protein [Adhaeribacter aerolatus]
MKTYFRLLAFAKPYSRFVPSYAILAILAVLFGLVNFSLLIPLLNVLFNTTPEVATPAKPTFALNIEYFKDLFNYTFYNIRTEKGPMGALQYVCAIILASVFLSNLFKYLSQRVMTSMRTYVVRNLRRALFEKISNLHVGYFHHQRKGDLLSSVSNDVSEIENSVVSSVQVVFREPLMIIGYFIFLFMISAQLTLFTLLILPISGGIIAFIGRKLRRDAKRGQDLLGNLLSVMEETISGNRIIKAFNAQTYVQEKFDIENNRYKDVLSSVWNKRELASPVSEFLGITVVVGVLLYGGHLIINQQSDLSASEFITFIALYSQILIPAKNISTAMTNIQRGIASGDRILKIIDYPEQVTEKPNALPLPAFTSGIEYRNVDFQYEKEKVLNNISLTVPKGKMVALIGQSGSGKSTLADLLPRFYDVTGGQLLIDGIDIRDIKITDLREQMGIVTQEAILFNDTIFNNIAFNKINATEAEVINAAKIANAHEFIMQTPNGYNTLIGDRGGKLSGGQKQRISIARAILKNPPILILDEATSALDTESEKLVQEALTNLMKNRTSIVIAHRLSTVQHADEIVVMQKGQIMERGTHEQLLAQNGLYTRLNQMQVVALS